MNPQSTKALDKECLGTHINIKDEMRSSDDVKNISLINSDTAHIRSSQLLLQEIIFEIRSEDILHLITRCKSIQGHINDKLRNVNARIVQPDEEDTHICLEYYRFELHSIKDWQTDAIQSFSGILQDFSIETVPVKQEILQNVLREVNRCHKRLTKQFDLSFDNEDLVVCGLKNAVEIIVSAINETVASHTTNQQYTPQILNHETAEREVSLYNISECEDNNTYTVAHTESSSDRYGHSELCQNRDIFTYRQNQGKQGATGKNLNPSKDSREENCLQTHRMPYKEKHDNGRDNRQDSAIISNTTNPEQKETKQVKSAYDFNQPRKIRTNKKKRACRSAPALLVQYVSIMVSIMPIAALTRPPGFNSEEFCDPKFSGTGQNDDLFRKLECYIPTCTGVSKILYEKIDVHSPEQWTPVFVGIDKTNFHSLDAGNSYTLSHRYDYYVFQTNHILYIDPITLEDNGKWRCVVVDKHNIKYESNAVNVQINVTPTEDTFIINPISPYMVTGGKHEFTCSVGAVYQKPDVVWNVNGMEYGTGTSERHKKEDGLWSINNTITVGFDFVGKNELTCVLKTEPMRQRDISIDVKEAAMVLHPVKDMSIALQTTSTFILLCSGVGYRPNIRWGKDGIHIPDNDERYIIQSLCDNAGCTGSITETIDDSQSACQHKEHYAGVYTCVMSLELPYNSSQVSPRMNIYIPENLCSDTNAGLVIGLAVFSSVCVVTTMIIVVVVVLLVKHSKRSNMDARRVQQGLMEQNV